MRVYKHEGKRGATWYAVFDISPDPVTGNRRQRRAKGKTKKEAEANAWEIIRKVERGGYVDGGKIALRDYFKKWLEDFGKGAWEPTTYTRSSGLINNHIIPEIGHIKLEKLTAADLTRLYRSKLDGGRLDGKPGGLSHRSVRYMHAIIKQALSHAVKWGLILYNAADAVDQPKHQKRDMTTWNEAQLGVFLSHAYESRYYAPLALMVLTGLRRGEALGLRWSDLDLQRKELTVQQALKDNQGTLYFGQPKRHRSRRPVALSDDAVALLRRHRASQHTERLAAGSAWQGSRRDLVFSTEIGTPLHPSNLGRAYRAIVKRSGLPYIRPHDLRHSHASVLLADGTPIKVISERLGHASTAFTMDVYSHVLPDMQREAADRLGDLVKLPGA